MKVNDLHGAIRSLDPRDLQRPDKPPERTATSTQQSADGDSLDVSLSAHVSARSAEASAAEEQDSPWLSPARLAELRGRIQSGFYDQPEILSQTTDKLLNFYSR